MSLVQLLPEGSFVKWDAEQDRAKLELYRDTGRARPDHVGHLYASVLDYSRGECADLQQQLEDQIDVEFDIAIEVERSYLEPWYRGQGIGRALYDDFIERAYAAYGPFAFSPNLCGTEEEAGTSFEAYTVWQSLARRYPSVGFSEGRWDEPQLGVIAVLEPVKTAAIRRRVLR